MLEDRIKEHIGTDENEAIQELVCVSFYNLINDCNYRQLFFSKVDFERMAFKSAQADTLKKISS